MHHTIINVPHEAMLLIFPNFAKICSQIVKFLDTDLMILWSQIAKFADTTCQELPRALGNRLFDKDLKMNWVVVTQQYSSIT